MYPENRIRFTSEGQEIRRCFPAMLVLELYRAGTLPQDAKVAPRVGGVPVPEAEDQQWKVG